MDNGNKDYLPVNRQQDLTFGQSNADDVLRHFPEYSDLIDPFGYKEDFWGESEVSQPGDASEVQAEGVADAVINDDIAASRELMKLPVSENFGDSKLKTPEGFDEKLDAQKGGGVPLEEAQQEKLEKHLDTDLSEVRLHTGLEAQELAEQVNARAFTKGNDIFFGEEVSEELLAHEVAHTYQHSSSKIHRAVKFEIQTGNYIWQKDSEGNFSHVKRKFGEYGGLTEEGGLPAYITTGKHGVKASKKGDVEYEQIKGDIATVKAEAHYSKFVPATGIDESKGAQFVIKKLLKNRKDIDSGKMPDEKDVELIEELDKKSDPIHYPVGTYNEGIYEFIYYEKYDPSPIGPYQENVNIPVPLYKSNKGVLTATIVKFMMIENVKKDVDGNLPAQFIKNYRFTSTVDVDKLIDTATVDGQFELMSQKNNADTMAANTYNANTFEFRYFNSGVTDFADDTLLLPIHLNPDGEYKKGHIKWMKVGREKNKKVDNDKEAQYIEIWKITEDENGDVSYYDPIQTKELMVKLENIAALGVDHSDTEKYPDVEYNTSTYEMKYYWGKDFSGQSLNNTATQLNVHLNDGRLKPGHVKFMEKKISKGNTVKIGDKKIEVGKEQTAMELQSESHGFIEFETPKWFTNWEDLKLRVQDAVEMTKKLSSAPLVTLTSGQKTQMQSIKDKDDRHPPKGEPLGDIREWPTDMISPGVLKKLGGNKLYVEIVDYAWPAFFQVSESIHLSDVGKMLKEEKIDMSPFSVQGIAISVGLITDKIIQSTKLASSTLKGKDDSLFSNLKGFLELTLSYIIWGQLNNFRGHKDTFPAMARTNFASLYDVILSEDEKLLFKEMLGDEENMSEIPPIFAPELKTLIDSKGGISITLDKNLRFYRKGHRADTDGNGNIISNDHNPKVYDWLVKITKHEDILSGKDVGNVSDAIGGKEVNDKTGDKDYKMALFEQRHGFDRKNPSSAKYVFRDGLADGYSDHYGWEQFAKDQFDKAMTRTSDTPDDPTTSGKDETSKTSISLD